jgi:hypothetical protein
MYSMFYIQIRYTYLYIYVHIILYVPEYYIYICTHICIYICVCMYVCIYIYMYMDTYIYVCICICIYIYILFTSTYWWFQNLGLDKCNITRFQYMEYFDGNGQTSSILFEVQCKVRILNRSLPYLKQPRKWKLTHWKTSCFPKKNNRILLPGLRSGILFSQSGYGSRCSNPA